MVKGNKPGCCWCGRELITGIIDSAGKWFPFGFANCPKHGCWFEPGDQKKGKKHAVKFSKME